MTGLSLQNFSLGCILHVHTRKPLMCLLVITINWKIHKGGLFICTRKIFPTRSPFIEIYGESKIDVYLCK